MIFARARLHCLQFSAQRRVSYSALKVYPRDARSRRDTGSLVMRPSWRRLMLYLATRSRYPADLCFWTTSPFLAESCPICILSEEIRVHRVMAEARVLVYRTLIESLRLMVLDSRASRHTTLPLGLCGLFPSAASSPSRAGDVSSSSQGRREAKAPLDKSRRTALARHLGRQPAV